MPHSCSLVRARARVRVRVRGRGRVRVRVRARARVRVRVRVGVRVRVRVRIRVRSGFGVGVRARASGVPQRRAAHQRAALEGPLPKVAVWAAQATLPAPLALVPAAGVLLPVGLAPRARAVGLPGAPPTLVRGAARLAQLTVAAEALLLVGLRVRLRARLRVRMATVARSYDWLWAGILG